MEKSYINAKPIDKKKYHCRPQKLSFSGLLHVGTALLFASFILIGINFQRAIFLNIPLSLNLMENNKRNI
jgi:hypothetical protein